jgi:hypothetical protein
MVTRRVMATATPRMAVLAMTSTPAYNRRLTTTPGWILLLT